MPNAQHPRAAVTATQLLLHTLHEAKEPLSVHELMEQARRIARRLRDAGLGVEVFFRGPYCGNMWSEQLERTLWYWLSNGFVEENLPGQRLTLSASGRRLFEDKGLSNAIHRNLDQAALSELTSVVRETLVGAGE